MHCPPGGPRGDGGGSGEVSGGFCAIPKRPTACLKGLWDGRGTRAVGASPPVLTGARRQCAAGGCLIELAQELLVIMVGKQIINNVQEMLVP